MQKYLPWKLAGWCLALIVWTQNSSVGAEPTVAELISLAPAFSSDDPRCRSIEIEGFVSKEFESQLHILLAFRAVYRSPDRFALFVNDGTDGTPLFGVADKRAFLYDPVRPVVFYLKDIKPSLVMLENEGRVEYGFGFTNKKEPAQLRGDLKSLIPPPTKDNTLLETVDGTFRLTVKSQRGNPLVATFQASQPPRCRKVEIFIKGNEQPIFAVNKIAIDGELKDEEFALPSKEQLSRIVSVEEFGGGDVRKNFGDLVQACAVRVALHHPELRPAIRYVDWDKVKASDKVFSKALRDMVSNRQQVQ